MGRTDAFMRTEMRMEMKKWTMGERYCFEKYLSDWDAERCFSAKRMENPVCAASLTIGCVKLELCRYPDDEPGKATLDLLVKDKPESREWIGYDCIGVAVKPFLNRMESEMFRFLDVQVKEKNLSYTACDFERIKGSVQKKEEIKESDEEAWQLSQ